MRKFFILSLVAVVAVLGLVALVGCGGGTTTTTAAPTETTAAPTETTASGSTETTAAAAVTPLDPPVTVTIAFDNAPGTAGLILADQLGYFKDLGINIKWVEFSSGALMFNSLAAGQVDVGRGIITASLFNGAAQGAPVWVVADSGTNVPGKGSYFTVVIRKDLENQIKDYADLKGRKIGIVSVGSINEYFLRKALDKGGLTIKDVKPVIIAEFPDLNTALGNKAIDAAVQIEPLITTGETAGILKYFKDAEDYAPDEQVAVLLYSDKFAKNTEVAKRFMLAHLKGVRVYNDAIVQGNVDRDKIIGILTKKTFIDKAETWTAIRPTGLNPDGTVLDKAVAGQQDYYATIGEVKDKVTMDKLLDPSFAQWAVQQLGPYSPPK